MKKLLIVAALIIVQLAQAKDVVIVIKTGLKPPKGKTEVKTEQGTSSDTLIVTPAKNVAAIQVAIKDMEGNTLTDEVLPADVNQTLNLTIPNSSSGSLLEIKDDKETVYIRFN